MPTNKSSPEKAYHLWKKSFASWKAEVYLRLALHEMWLGIWDEREFRKTVPRHPDMLKLRKVLKESQRSEFDRALRALPKELSPKSRLYRRAFDKFAKERNITQKGSVFQSISWWRVSSRYLKSRLFRFLGKFGQNLHEKLRRIPFSIEKAESYLRAAAEFTHVFEPHMYEAVIYLNEHGYDVSQVVKQITKEWREERQRREQILRHEGRVREESEDGEPPEEERFWYVTRAKQALFDICMYRFWRHFSLDGFDTVFGPIESYFEEGLLSGHILGIPSPVYLLSKTEAIKQAMPVAIEVYLTLLMKKQRTNGCWTTVFNREESAKLTAENSLVLLRLGRNRKTRAAGIKGARRLLEKQSADGFWTSPEAAFYKGRGEKSGPQPSILTTCLATQAIIEAGIVKSSYTLEAARDWLLEQHGPIGWWTFERLYPVVSTVIVLETLEAIGAYKPKVQVIDTTRELVTEETAAFIVYNHENKERPERASLERYKQLYRLKNEGKFDLFIDVTKGMAFSLIKGKLKDLRLLRDEAACLAEYIQEPGVAKLPGRTAVGRKTALGERRAAPAKLFTNARSKVDPQIKGKGKREYRWFKTHTTSVKGQCKYSFEPGASDYCLIETLPAKDTEPST